MDLIYRSTIHLTVAEHILFISLGNLEYVTSWTIESDSKFRGFEVASPPFWGQLKLQKICNHLSLN